MRITTQYMYSPDEDEERATAALAAQPLPPPKVDPQVDPIGALAAKTAEAEPPPAADPIGALSAKRTEIEVPDHSPTADPIRGLTGQSVEHSEVSESGPDNDSDGDEQDGPPGLNPWALIADLALNKGKGVGQIISMAEKQKAQWLHDRRAGRGTQADLELRRGHLSLGQQQLAQSIENSKRNYEIAKINAGLRDEGLDVKKDSNERLNRQWSDKSDPDSAYNRTRVIQKHDERAASTTGDIDAKHENVDTIAGDRAQIAEAVAVATQPSKIELRKLETPALEETRAQHDKANERAERAEARAVANDNRKGVEDVRKLRAEAQQRTQADRQWGASYEKNSAYAGSAKQSLDKLSTILAKYGNDPSKTPGIGFLETGLGKRARGAVEWAHELKGPKGKEYAHDMEEVANALQGLQQYNLRKETGAAAPTPEILEMAQRIGNMQGLRPEQIVQSLNAINTIVSSELTGLASGNERMARQVLRQRNIDPNLVGLPPGEYEYGQEPWRKYLYAGLEDDGAQPQAAPAAPQQRAPTMGSATNQPSDHLGDVGIDTPENRSLGGLGTAPVPAKPAFTNDEEKIKAFRSKWGSMRRAQ